MKPIRILLLLALGVVLFLLLGCAVKGEVHDDSLVIAACPELTDVKLVTPAESWQLHVDDAEQYNTCRCAALRNTKAACRKP